LRVDNQPQAGGLHFDNQPKESASIQTANNQSSVSSFIIKNKTNLISVENEFSEYAALKLVRIFKEDIPMYENYVYTPVTQQPVPKKKGFGRKGFAAMLIAACMLGSAVFGFGGTYLANSLNNGASPSEETVYANTPDNSAVTYQSVVQTIFHKKSNFDR